MGNMESYSGAVVSCIPTVANAREPPPGGFLDFRSARRFAHGEITVTAPVVLGYRVYNRTTPVAPSHLTYLAPVLFSLRR